MAANVSRKPRADRSTPDVHLDRIDHIVGMMRRLEWRRGETGPVLAKQWDLAVPTVENMASEARRVVAREVTDPDHVQLNVCTVLEETLSKARATNDFPSIINAAKAWSAISGAIAPQRIEVSAASAPWHGLPPEQQLARLDVAIEKLQAMRIELLPRCAIVSHSPPTSATALLTTGESIVSTDSNQGRRSE